MNDKSKTGPADSTSSGENALVPFEFDGTNVRVMWRDHAPWFVARDVAKVLGYSDPNKAIRDHCKGANETVTPSAGSTQTVKIIPERDLYRLIMCSKLPVAELFEEWLVDEMLPVIRKAGAYGASPVLPDFTDPAAAARAWAEQYEKRKALEQERAVMLLDAEFYHVEKKHLPTVYLDQFLCELQLASGGEMSFSEIMDRYGRYCKDHDIHEEARNYVGKRLKDLGFRHRRRSINNSGGVIFYQIPPLQERPSDDGSQRHISTPNNHPSQETEAEHQNQPKSKGK